MKVLQSSQINKAELDLYDKKILHYLSQNSRQSYTQIAKQVGLSRDSIRYRITRLKEAGVLQGFRTIVDIVRLGYLNVHLFIQLNQPTQEAETKLVKKFAEYPFVRAIIKFSGKYDIELAIIAKDLQELEEITSKVAEDCGNSLQDLAIHFITKSFTGKTLPDSFLKAAQMSKPTQYDDPSLDEKDYELLRTIADDADLPLHEIAIKTKMSADTAKYRMKKLKQSGIIKGYIPVVNFGAMGYNVYAILMSITQFSGKKEAQITEFLRTNKNILWAVKAIGKYNLMLYICTNDPDDLMKTTADLRSYLTESLRDFETLINYAEYKYTYFPDIASKVNMP